ncbi:sodium channel protein 60E isoform X3 [Cryptotermes secundus]|uniref:sodium channel protein 60E isoform X3 n=1 Tax=Cryptotermes secundus TaxID=105785 RepID=UPI001454DAB1|nr:sodium channel protein 60E isoform X3 [Cryptotermes secundus]
MYTCPLLTFCVVSKRFRKNYIHRFTATNSFFMFSPWNAVRRTCIFLSTNQYFDYVVMITILLNCVFLAMSDTVEEAEYIFLAIYTAEMIIKSIAKGFILNKYTYLRNPWNWLDFVVITSGYATIGMDVGNLAGLRTFRVLRALKTVSIMPGLKTIINALLHSFKQLAEVMTLTIFCLMVFALFALQVYMGELRNKCVRRLEDANATALEWVEWVHDPENWLKSEEDEEPVICGNVTGARHCPLEFFCLQVGENPNHGYTNFDNFLWSMLTTFQLITLDYWENVYNMVLSSCGPISVVFFTVVVFFGSFYLINLMLAVVALSYEEEAEITQEERRKDLTDHRDDSTFSFDPSKINVKQLDKHKRKRVDSRKGVLLASYTRKKTRRRKRGRGGGCGSGDNNTGVQSQSQGQQGHSRSATPSPRHSSSAPCPEQRPQSLTLTPPPQAKGPATPQPPATCSEHAADTLHPANALAPGPPHRGQLLTSRHPSSNNSDNNNRESSLDDSGVVDDHEEGDVTSEDVTQIPNVVQRMEPVTVALSSKEIRVIKCNGVSPGQGTQKHMYTLPSDYLSHIVVLDDLPDRNCDKCTQCCVDYDGWLRFQSGLYKVVRDPLFDLLITLCIILNTMFLAMEHHGMSGSVRQALDIGNKVFTSIFTLECFLKILALSKEYFACGWNIFDLIIVSASLLDLSFELMDSLVVLRCLRLLRVLKLARSWTTMKVLLSIIISTIGALGNLTFVLVIVIYIFAVIGMQLFSKDYTAEKFYPDPIPRWNFNDFFHSFMMVFRILCGEWIEPLWDCMRAERNAGPETCFAIFLPALVMGNFMVLNLFLALLLNSFNSEELKSKKEPDDDEDAEAAEYVAQLQQHMQSATKLCQKCWCPYSRMSVAPAPPVPLFHHRHTLPSHPRQTSTLPDVPNHNQIPEDTSSSLFLHCLQEEVGEESKLARSFERLRSIVRKKRQGREKTQNERNMRLEEMVREVMTQHAAEKYYNASNVHETVIGQTVDHKCHVELVQEHSQPTEGMDYGAAGQKVEDSRNSKPESNRLSPSFPRVVNSIVTGELEERKYSVSCHEDLNKHTEDKRYSLVLPKSVVSNMAESEKDKHSSPSREDITRKEPSSDQEDSMLRPLVGKQVSLSTQQTESKDETNAEESIELEVLDKPPEETETMLPEKHSDTTKTSKQPWQALASYVDELTVGGRRDSQGHYVDGMGSFPGFGRNKSVKVPQDCFPQHCYQRSVCCDQYLTTPCGQRWTHIRTQVLSVVDTPVFEWFILVLIFASSITLCFEDIYLDENIVLKNILYWTNLGFCALFSVEMMLKWLALGFWRYFTSFWTILDFIIVFVSIFSLLIEENENLKVLRSLRTLRALRPLRAISRWQGMRIVVNALMYAIPSIFNVLLVCLVFWLIFSIMGVQFFGGKFFKCVNEEGNLLPVIDVDDVDECKRKNYSWVNSKITFDNVGNAYLALFQVATFEGWMEVMSDAVDARGVNLQPQREANLYAYLYFVVFIVCGSFFTLNLFIGVIIDNFNMLKKKYEGGVLEMFLTESQKHYYTAMKKLGRKKPQKVIKRPMNQVLAMFYDLSNSRRFEIAIFVLIFLNMLTMGIEHYNQPHAIFFVLEVSNAFFTTVFGLEAIVKIIGLRFHYFTVPWNLFDFLLVVASILGILMEDIMIDFPVSPTLLRVVRVFRIGRILRLIKAAKGIRKLLFALVVSLPALFNIGALLALITFIYAIIGMSVFGHVRQQGALDDMVNFETFGRSMQLLFRLMTSAGWNDVLESLMVQPPNCNPTYNNQPNGDCGSPLLAITYFTSFIIISYMIVINMYIAIILENFNQAHQEEEIGIVEDDLEMFYIRWSKYDPHATQFIRFTQLSDFIASLDPPLGIPKPNIVALVSFNLPIARGNKIHCLDILHSLVKYVLGHVEETEDFRKLQDQMDIKFKKQFPTRKELEIVSSTRIWKRQDKAARTIQAAFREYIRLKREREREPLDLEDEMTQTSSPGGWQSRLSAFLHVHRGSRASSRKSSRASDASDLSELGGAWLNLPLLFLSGAHQSQTEDHEEPAQANGNGNVCIMVSEPSPDTGPFSTEEPKQGSSLVLPLSMKDELQKPLNSGDVSILVTEASPEAVTMPCEEERPSHTSQTSNRSQESDDRKTVSGLETALSSGTSTAALDRHPLGLLRPVGTVLSLFPMQLGSVNDTYSVPRKPASEAVTGPVDMHPVRVRPGTGLSLPPSDPSMSRKVAKSSPERRRARLRRRRSSDATLVQVLVHRESEESTDDKGS